MLEFHVGNLYTRVEKKKATKEEISAVHKLLSVKVPGYYFSRQYKFGMWSGEKHFFNKLTCQCYTGLLGICLKSLPEQGIECSVVDERIEPQHQNNGLDLYGISLRDYQERMIKEALVAKRGVIAGATNSGKTECAAGLIKTLGLSAVFLTHRIGLLQQTHERFEERLQRPIGWLGAGIRDLKDINIISVKTLADRLKEKDEEITAIMQNTPIVIIDECHRAAAKTFEDCLRLSRAYYRWGLSATPFHRDEVSNMLVRGLIGDTVTQVSNAELIKWGVSAEPTVYLIPVYVPRFAKKHVPYDIVYNDGIVLNAYRNELIAQSAKHFLDKGKSVFVIIWRIDHGEEVKKWMERYGITCEFISGEGSTPKKNAEVLKRFKEKKLKCVISSSISDEGMDIPAMDVLIIGVGDKSALKAVQRVGRGLRKKVGVPNVVTIVDFVDFQNRYLLNHSRDRCAVYG